MANLKILKKKQAKLVIYNCKFLFISDYRLCDFILYFSDLEEHLLAEKNDEIKLLNSIIIGLHKKLSAHMVTDIFEFVM